MRKIYSFFRRLFIKDIKAIITVNDASGFAVGDKVRMGKIKGIITKINE